MPFGSSGVPVGPDDDRGGGVVLGGEDVAGDPADVGAQRDQGLDEHGGLHGHVQRARDRGPRQRLCSAVLARACAIRPGISCSASWISLRPYSASDRSATLKSWTVPALSLVRERSYFSRFGRGYFHQVVRLVGGQSAGRGRLPARQRAGGPPRTSHPRARDLSSVRMRRSKAISAILMPCSHQIAQTLAASICRAP